MNLYGSKVFNWLLCDRWYFKSHIKSYSLDELLTLWHNVKLVRGNDFVRRDIGRMICKAAQQLHYT